MQPLCCGYCKGLFEGSSNQRSKFRRSGGVYKACCSRKCLYALRALNATKPPGHYDQICSECGDTFRSSASQLHRRNINPDKKVVCSEVCNNRRRSTVAQVMHKKGKLKWGSAAQIAVFAAACRRSGPTHHTWKTGWHSKEMRQAKRLVHSIKKFINQGANR